MKLLLHIGTDKTGSTAIQRHLYENRSWFLSHGIYVPLTRLGKDNGHGDLLAHMEGPEMRRLAEEVSEAREAGVGYAVISWEGMCFMDAGQIATLGNALASENLWLLVYLREQADILQTGYLQEIKTDRSPVAIADFQGPIWKLSHLRALRYCHSPMRNYARLLRQWMAIIPRGQVIAREYQRDRLIGSSVVDDFLAVMDLSADEAFIRFTTDTNISLDVESAIIVNRIDCRTDLPNPRKAYIYTLLSIIHSDGFAHRYFLSRRRVAAIRRYYSRSNKAIGAVIGSPLPGLFSGAPACTRSYTPEAIVASVAQREQRLAALQSMPMLFTTRPPHDAPTPGVLVSGWHTLPDGSAWSQGDVSEIHFRVPFWMISHERAKVIIFIRGRYSGDHNRSRVEVNQRDFGWLDLRHFSRTIALPVSALGPNQAVVVRIHHDSQAARTERQDLSAMDPGVFGIEKFGIQITQRQ